MRPRYRFASAAIAAGLMAPVSALAVVNFTFDDPSGAREFQYTEGDGQNPGQISYASPQSGDVLQLTIDASDHGLEPITLDATLEIDLAVGVASDLGFGASSGITGVFQFYEMTGGDLRGESSNLILEGVVTDGVFLVIGSTGAQVSSSSSGSLTLGAGPVLQSYLDMAGLFLSGEMDSSFSLSSIRLPDGTTATPRMNQFGYVESFNSNAAYVGSAEVVPSPTAGLLLAALAFSPLTRRRRAG